jgi:hypothetical protein
MHPRTNIPNCGRNSFVIYTRFWHCVFLAQDPYAVISFGGSKEKFTTKVAKDEHSNPVWNFACVANLTGDEDLMHVRVYNKEALSDDLIGRTDYPLDQLDLSNKPKWYALKHPDDFKRDAGEIQITMQFEGTGLPESSESFTTHRARIAPTATVSPAPVAPAPVSPPQQQYQPQQQQYAPPPQQYQQPPQQQYQQPPQQQQYQQPPQQYQQPPQQYQQQPQYQQPQQFQQQQQQQQYRPPQPQYGAPQYAPQYPPQQQQQQPQYAQPPVVYQQPQPPQVVYQAPQPQVVSKERDTQLGLEWRAQHGTKD